jgi:hypothetical protein
LPSDAGKIVTNQEVVDFVTNITAILDPQALLIQAVEATVEEYCQRTFALTEYEDEQIAIRNGQYGFDDYVTKRRLEFLVKNYPVTEWTSLKMITGLDSEGALQSTELSRGSYFVDTKVGRVTLIYGIPVTNAYALRSWPTGAPSLLAHYTAGFDSDEMPPNLKLGVLMIMARISGLADVKGWSLTTFGSQFTTPTTLKRVMLTDEEKMALSPFRRMAAA